MKASRIFPVSLKLSKNIIALNDNLANKPIHKVVFIGEGDNKAKSAFLKEEMGKYTLEIINSKKPKMDMWNSPRGKTYYQTQLEVIDKGLPKAIKKQKSGDE